MVQRAHGQAIVEGIGPVEGEPPHVRRVAPECFAGWQPWAREMTPRKFGRFSPQGSRFSTESDGGSAWEFARRRAHSYVVRIRICMSGQTHVS